MAGAALAVALMVACATGGPKTMNMDWVYAAIHPPMVVQDGTSVDVYRRWWEETEDCLGLRYEFGKVTWLVVRTKAHGTFKIGGHDSLVGFTFGRPRGGVTVLLSQRYWLVPEVVRHQSVHAITGMTHEQLPEDVFDRCSKGETL